MNRPTHGRGARTTGTGQGGLAWAETVHVARECFQVARYGAQLGAGKSGVQPSPSVSTQIGLVTANGNVG